MTVAEYAEWGMSSDAPDSRDELIDGVIVPLLPHYVMHALANGLIAFKLGQYFDQHPPGYATIGSGVVVGPDSVLSVDVAVYPWAYEESDGPGGWGTETPAICVDIVSPWDRMAQLQRRVMKYHAAGVPVVWQVQPEDRAVIVHGRGCGVEYLDGDDVLTADPELPGFACRVSAFFTPPGRS